MNKIKVKDIDFRSADHVIQEIENMNVKGGSPFGRASAWAYKLAIQQEDLTDLDMIIARFEVLKNKMNELKPTMATINNTSSIIEKTLNSNKNKSIEEIKEIIVKVADNIINYSFEAVDKVGKFGATFIKDGDIILMHSYSSTLMAIFIEAANQEKNFKVICTESRPLRESRNAVNILQDLNIETTFISDASVYEFLPTVDYVIMGADTLSVDGAVANKMGTAQIAKLALFCKKPVYIASELYKLSLRTQEGYPIELERRTQWELVNEDDFKTADNLEVINQFFDLTPAIDIKAIITEFGFLNPSQMLMYWNKLEESLGVE